MNRLEHTKQNAIRRKMRIRNKVNGTTERPRLSVFVSSTNVSAQVIDDSKQATLVSATSIGNKDLQKKTLTEKAAWVGEAIAKSATKKKITHVVLDRNGKLYHGRVKALAESARQNGLEF